MKGETVERVESYKYRGISFDDKLSWKCHVDPLVKRVHSRLYWFRKIRSFEVRDEILQMFYAATISGVLTFGVTYWGGNASKQKQKKKERKKNKNKKRYDNNIKKAGTVLGKRQKSLDSLSSASDKQTENNFG